MKTNIILVFALSSSISLAACPDIADTKLNDDQIAVKNLLSSAYKYQSGGVESRRLAEFTQLLKSKWTQASESLNSAEVASFIVELDNDNKICPEATYIPSETFTELISEKIIDTYYGCGCSE